MSSPPRQIPEAVQAGLRAHKVAMEHIEWLRERQNSDHVAPSSDSFQLQLRTNVLPELDLIFGSGVKRLAIEYIGDRVEQREDVVQMDFQEECSSSGNKQIIMKTDYKDSGLKGRKRNKPSKILDMGNDAGAKKTSSSMCMHRSDSSGSEASS